ncbi:hypothetical protein OF83DRAFT_919201 [Amylostereum chailletii]|nr:hypothetical protein OF83DRAFT_919201 [Amylostereum chailletii]
MTLHRTLPSVLHHISPSLAACHASRARILEPEDTSLALAHCHKCGTYLLDGSGSIRTTRLARSSKRRTRCTTHLRTHCTVCGHVGCVPLPPTDGDAPSASFPMPRASARLLNPPSTMASAPHAISSRPAQSALDKTPQHAPSSRSHSTLNPSPSVHPLPISAASQSQTAPQTQVKKTRPKKKAGLHELLARNRDKQQQASGQPGAGLSAFLTDL